MDQRACLQSHLKGLAEWDKHLPLCFGSLDFPRKEIQGNEKTSTQKLEVTHTKKSAAEFLVRTAFWHPFYLLYVVYDFCILVSDDQGCHQCSFKPDVFHKKMSDEGEGLGPL